MDRMEIIIMRTGEPITPVRWYQTPEKVSVSEPLLLENPIYPKGASIDTLGQSTLHSFVNKFSNSADLIDHLEDQLRKIRKFILA